MAEDAYGTWWSWSEIFNTIDDFCTNVWNAAVSAIEFEFGIGFGLDADVGGVGLGYSNDIFIGVDDGKTIAGHKASVDVGVIGQSATHYSEKGDEAYRCRACGTDYRTGIDYFRCSHSEINTYIGSVRGHIGIGPCVPRL